MRWLSTQIKNYVEARQQRVAVWTEAERLVAQWHHDRQDA